MRRPKDCNCVYCQGKRAFLNELTPDDCPHIEGSRDHWKWMDGYVDADAQESGDID